ncbi:MAG: hypothetical protein KIT12_10885 [Trueperaceae bacterium]|nr:hypothetical protein [Trueperaceae bacterium]
MNEPKEYVTVVERTDEVSLRDLYLIFRRGFRLIAAVALVAAGAAFAYLSTKPASYVASATVQVTAPQPTTSGELASLVPQVGMGMQSYTSLAMSNAVLAEALEEAAAARARREAGGDQGAEEETAGAVTAGAAAAAQATTTQATPTQTDGPPTQTTDTEALKRLLQSLKLTAIDTSNQSRGQLTIQHMATADSSAQAADLANGWAQAGARAATEAMRGAVDVAVTAATRELAARETALAVARDAWTAFLKDDARPALQSQLAQLATQQAAARSRLAELDTLIVSNGARQALLSAAAAARTEASPEPLDAQVRTLVDAGVLDAATAAGFAAAIAQLPAGVATGDHSVLALVSRARLESLAADLAGQVAERDQLQNDSDRAEREATVLRERLADLELRAATPQDALRNATAAYDRVAAVMPLLTLQQGMVDDAARVIIGASQPLEPKPRNRLTITVAAFLVGGLLATLFVFLRAAVAEPAAPPRARVAATGGGNPFSSQVPTATGMRDSQPHRSRHQEG